MNRPIPEKICGITPDATKNGGFRVAMGIVIKFILKNIYEKKFRTFLIIVSIMLSSALFFSSGAMTNTMTKMYVDRIRQFYGNTDLVITANEKSPSQFFNTAGLEKYRSRLEYSIGLIAGSASYKPSNTENVNLQLYGFNIEELQKIHPVAFYNNSFLPFEGREVIISKTTADKYGLKEGGTLELNVGNGKIPFRICTLAYPTGLFMDESQAASAIVPLETLQSIYYANGRVNLICIKTLDPSQKQEIMKGLADEYKRYTVKEPFSMDEIRQQTSSMSTGFMLMAVMVMIMSIFIIYTSFKVVTMERLPLVGVFRSVGATRRMTNAVLLAESILYGILGGGAGCGLGIGILYVMSYFSRPTYAPGFETTIAFTSNQLLTSFLLAVVLSFLSCILPILQVSRISVKDIVLNAMQKAVKKTGWKFFLGVGIIAVSLVLPKYVPLNLALMLNTVCLLLSVAGIILLVPYITALFIKGFEKLYAVIFGNIGILAAKNLKGNKSILNNISLLAIGISSLLMINTISGSVMKEVTNVYRSGNFGIWIMYMQQGDRNLERIIRQAEGVTGTYGVYEAFNVEMEGLYNGRISELNSVDGNRFADYWTFDYSEDRDSLFKKLNQGRTIIISNTLRDKYKLAIGDTVTLRLNGFSKPYVIAGFVNTIMDNGSYALISEKNMKLDTGIRYYTNMYVKTSGDPFKVQENVKRQMGKRGYYMKPIKQMENENSQSNQGVFVILKGFSVMALIIGIFGILNNLIISFIERKRSLAVLRSAGMSKKQTIGMMFIEALSGGIVGGISGSIAGFMLVYNIPEVLKAINLSVPLKIPYGASIYYIAAGALITIAASVSPAFKSSKLNVIEAVKYE